LAGLIVEPNEQVAIVGPDQAAAETIVNLIFGASLPDRGEVRVGGRSTSALSDGAEWLALADTIGIVSERTVLLDAYSALQNLAIPFSLDVEPMSAAVREDAAALAREVGLATTEWDRPLAEAAPASRLLVRLGCALALAPSLVLMEHPSMSLSRSEVATMGRAVRAVLTSRQTASLTLTADSEFAAAVARRVLRLDPATGELTNAQPGGWLGGWRRSQ
jgi:predicted ABC-type transport system involved in lysophospholipase L1 biosynthesis ATPase subunit